jgi:hypothetical protein
MPGKFELKKASNGQFFFNLKAGNGQVILSSEQYVERRSAEGGIASVQKNAANDSRYERKESSNGQSYFVLKATNGQTIGRSEMYTTAASMENGIESVKKNAPDAATVDLT